MSQKPVRKSRKLKPEQLQVLAESHLATLIVLTSIEGVNPEAKPYIDSATQMIALTLVDIQDRYKKATKQALDVSHVENAFTAPKEPINVQET